MQSNKQIQKILSANHKPFQIGLAVFGCLIGFFLILVSVQSILNFKFLFNDSKQGIGSQYLVINNFEEKNNPESAWLSLRYIKSKPKNNRKPLAL